MFTLDKCPHCGGRIQASVKVYLDDIVLEAHIEDGVRVKSSEDESKAIGAELGGWYCENDHELDDDLFTIFGALPPVVTLDGGSYSLD